MSDERVKSDPHVPDLSPLKISKLLKQTSNEMGGSIYYNFSLDKPKL